MHHFAIKWVIIAACHCKIVLIPKIFIDLNFLRNFCIKLEELNWKRNKCIKEITIIQSMLNFQLFLLKI